MNQLLNEMDDKELNTLSEIAAPKISLQDKANRGNKMINTVLNQVTMNQMMNFPLPAISNCTNVTFNFNFK